jgi:hypothetical protein
MITSNGRNSYSNVIRVDRGKLNSKITFNNLVTDQIALQISNLTQDRLQIKIIDQAGREIYHQTTKINPDNSLVNINTATISKGLYYIILSGVDYKEAFPFVKF